MPKLSDSLLESIQAQASKDCDRIAMDLMRSPMWTSAQPNESTIGAILVALETAYMRGGGVALEAISATIKQATTVPPDANLDGPYTIVSKKFRRTLADADYETAVCEACDHDDQLPATQEYTTTIENARGEVVYRVSRGGC